MTVQPLTRPIHRTRPAVPDDAPRPGHATSGGPALLPRTRSRPRVEPWAPEVPRPAVTPRDLAFEALLAGLPTGPTAHLDVPGRRFTVDGADVPLTRQELDLLVHLTRAAGRVVTRQELHEHVWRGRALPDDTRTVDVHVRRVRAKSGLDSLITTVRGVGYRLERIEGLTVVDPAADGAEGTPQAQDTAAR